MRLTVSPGTAQYVIVTDEAVITVQRRSAEEQRQAGTAALMVGGGFTGVLLAALVDRLGLPGGPMRLYLRPMETPPLSQMTEVLTCWASEVPPELSGERGWPAVEAFRPVTFYPRNHIESLELTAWRLTMTLRREAARVVTLAVYPWDYRRFREHLAQAGYLIAR